MLCDFKPQFKTNFILKRTAAPLYDPEGHFVLSLPLWETENNNCGLRIFMSLMSVPTLTEYMEIREAEAGNQQRQSGYRDDRSWGKRGEWRLQETLLTDDISGQNVTRGPGVKRCSCLAVVSNSLWPHGLYSPWISPSQNTGVGDHPLLQEIFPTKGSNPGLSHCKRILYQAEPPRKAKEMFTAWQRSVNLEEEALVRMKENSTFTQGRRGGWDCHLCPVKRNPKLYSTWQDP